jgi:hypothetical protein
MAKFLIQRTGDAPLKFEGELIAESDGKYAAGNDQNRWHNLRLYRTSKGNIVAECEYLTCWQGELGHQEAAALGSVAEAIEWFKGIIPATYVQGFPDKPEYQERQANLLNWIDKRLADQITEIAEEVGDEAAEEV